ncbi:hypothetical protein B9479_007701 [Cryptococcus floricola]|uniref:Major facilitator superfamily (MFS) profile domain-containing protein n=1 Tax=Cryptococcus floricola TaxID=2591691 RepID=A0A5D3ALP9_9TREE|nr:hypothetical protein B9479_007701 [Cryptococcus floricola]
MGFLKNFITKKEATVAITSTAEPGAVGNVNVLTDKDEIPLEDTASAENKKDLGLEEGNGEPDFEGSVGNEDKIDEDAQPGVKTAQATTLSWSRTSMVILYVSMFLLYFVNAFQSSITGNLTAYVTSGFSAHSLIPVISIVSNVMSAATYMPLAKALNLWDRVWGFIIMAGFATIGLILSATCKNIAVYCASQVFYGIGFVGMIFSIDVMTADTSRLRDRGLAYAFTSSPYIITAFAGSAASEHFYDSNWRWAFGCFAIVLPVVATPLVWVLWHNKQKAKAAGMLQKVSSGRTPWESAKYYFIEFDVIGVFLIAAGLVLFLLPFSIASSEADEWRSASVIVLLVFGVLCLAGFAVSQRWLSPKPFVPWRLLTNRSVIGACMLDFFYQIAYYCWDSYFTSYLQVCFNTSISVAGYVSSIFDIVSGVWLIIVGLLIRKTGYHRWLLMISVPLFILGEGLMIHFRKPGGHFGYIIMCQVFIAFGGGTITICEQLAVLAAASHNDAAAVLALLGLFGYTGGAVGNSISGAIWTHTFPEALQKYLPADALADWETIYEDLEVQLGYEWGSETRTAIIDAYADAQTRMLIAGTVSMAIAWIFVFVIKNQKVSALKQTKGLLF